ncbi:hypothetical protein HCU01_33830 [Halomonas cupida]|uniref:Uncharacterized protein n=1 Tax=Halomonas cupida TaxID=44933 RepID=A0ABQ0WI20_9GAMM|nr:hypothetical protein HCU01_33830 [Halomonas cupida]
MAPDCASSICCRPVTRRPPPAAMWWPHRTIDVKTQQFIPGLWTVGGTALWPLAAQDKNLPG